MKTLSRRNILLTCLSLILVVSALFAFKTFNRTVNASGENTIQMEKGASLYLNPTGDITTGLRFSFTDSAYDAEANDTYGMMIVANDMFEAALAALDAGDITDVEADDYVNLIRAASDEGVFNENDVPIFATVEPNASGVFMHSVGNLNGYNYVRKFFGIGYKETGENTYQYAELNDNVRSVFEVTNLALNVHVYDGGDIDGNGELDAEEEAEYNLIESSKTTLESFIKKGISFVYGTWNGKTTEYDEVALELNGGATYVGGDSVAITVKTAKTKNIDLDMHWRYSMEDDTVAELVDDAVSPVSRGQATVTAKLGGVIEKTATASVLKDQTEYKSYQNSNNANFFAIAQDDTTFAGNMVATGKAYGTIRLNGGYWNGAGESDGYSNPGYFIIQNPSSEDGKYTLTTTGTQLDFYFTGNNMPNVEFFGTKLKEAGIDFSTGGSGGYMVTNGIARSNTYSMYVNTVKPSYDEDSGTYDTSGWTVNSNYYKHGIVGSDNFFRFGVSARGGFNRSKYNSAYNSYFAIATALDDQNKSSGYNIMKYASSTWSMSAVTYGSQYSQFELMEQGEDQNWHYKVCLYYGTQSSKYYVRYSAKLYKVAGDGTETLYGTTKTVTRNISSASTSAPSVSGYIVVHGACKGSLAECQSAGNTGYYYTNLAYKLPTAAKFTS